MKKNIRNKKLSIARSILFFAALYNLAWGAWISLFPESLLFGAQTSPYFLMILQCVGMLVGVYGIAYWYASQDPARYWPLIFVGLIGKILGPIGAVVGISSGDLPQDFLIVNLGNDLIWLLPFCWVLYQVCSGTLTREDSQDGSLYQRFLGAQFNHLSPNLNRFHIAQSPIKVAGHFQVWRGSNLITQFMGTLANLPPEAEKKDVDLQVEQKNGEEIWHRRIGDHKVISKQWLSQGLLVEKFGPIRIYLQAQVNQGELLIYDHSATFWGVPFPPFFTPWVTAHGEDKDQGVMVTVEVGFFPFGRIIRYHGFVAEVGEKN